MKQVFTDAIRAAIAVQVGILECHDADVMDQTSIAALEQCEKILSKALKALRKELR